MTDKTRDHKIFHFFAEISAVPRISGDTSPIAEYLTEFAHSRGLEYRRDSSDNVIIKKPASAGYENAPAVILQAHTDMVGDGSADALRKMRRDGVTLIDEGDFIRADDTTLGADDGFGMAYVLTLLDGEEYEHPPIEAIFTSNEEIGLLGASALDLSDINGRLMINLDSDVEGEFTAGCAGGVRLDIRLPVLREMCVGYSYNLKISGLAGGHSGMEIDKGRINAIKLAAEIIDSVDGVLATIQGGSADNAIAAFAECGFKSERKYAEICDTLSDIKKKYAKETGLSLLLTEGDDTVSLTKDRSAKILSLIEKIPSGVVEMSAETSSPLTSANQGMVSMSDMEFRLAISLRSSSDTKKEALKEEIKTLCTMLGASVKESGDYPGWEYRNQSNLREIMVETYRNIYNSEPKVINIHAGLECGIFARGLSGLDCVSIGANIKDIHTRAEKLDADSFIRVFEYLIKVLKRIN